MTLSHRLKLIPARIGWRITYIVNMLQWINRGIKFKELKQLQEEIHDKYILISRVTPTFKESYILQGQKELLDKLIETWPNKSE